MKGTGGRAGRAAAVDAGPKEALSLRLTGLASRKRNGGGTPPWRQARGGLLRQNASRFGAAQQGQPHAAEGKPRDSPSRASAPPSRSDSQRSVSPTLVAGARPSPACCYPSARGRFVCAGAVVVVMSLSPSVGKKLRDLKRLVLQLRPAARAAGPEMPLGEPADRPRVRRPPEGVATAGHRRTRGTAPRGKYCDMCNEYAGRSWNPHRRPAGLAGPLAALRALQGRRGRAGRDFCILHRARRLPAPGEKPG
jgi:hypothetical protein